MRFLPSRIGARLRAFLGPDTASVRQSLAALLVSSGGDLLAGLTLGAITHTLEALPGLLVLVPAAIGMRGNIFGAMGSRLGTAIHSGTFHLSRRPDTVLGQNVLASLALTFGVSAALAVLAKTVAVAFGLGHTISIADFMVISVLGGLLSSAVVLLITVWVAAGAVRFDWDMDNVAAPLVTAAGDVVTLPSLFLATYLVGFDVVTPVIAGGVGAVSLVAVVAAIQARQPILRRIVRESIPVLLFAAVVDVVAGITIEKRLDSFLRYPALLVLIPPFLAETGALGGIVASRLSSKLHLGVIEPSTFPQRAARYDLALALVLAVPIYALVSVAVDVAASLLDLSSPGALVTLQVAMIAGLTATAFAVGIAYFTSIAAFRLGLDPDNHSIPLITSSLDLVATVALIVTIAALGLT